MTTRKTALVPSPALRERARVRVSSAAKKEKTNPIKSALTPTLSRNTGEGASKKHCHWVGKGKDFYDQYHDTEWGVPVHDDRKHFEFLILEGAQAGLSWETILKRRDAYRKAFKNFDPVKVARMTDAELHKLLKDESIIRNKLKIFAARKNAQAFLSIQKEFGSFENYVWKFVGGKPIVNKCQKPSDIPVTTKESDALSKDLKKRGMSFVGSTIIYAHMQATGLVNDHLVGCFRYQPCKKIK